MPRYFYYLLLVTGLFGCDNQPPISNFIKQINQSNTADLKAEDSPQQLFTVSQFTGRDHRSPFELPPAIHNQLPASTANKLLGGDLEEHCQPIIPRNKTHFLEQFSLQQLQLRGVMGSQGKTFGLIEVPKGQILTFQQGDYLGLNNGKVIEITSKYVLIKETLISASGCEQQRVIKLALR